MPGLRVSLRPFPPHDGGAVDAEGFGEAFLAQPDGLAALGKPVPTPIRHVPPPFASIRHGPFTQLTPCDAMGMRQFCAVAALGASDRRGLSRRMAATGARAPDVRAAGRRE